MDKEPSPTSASDETKRKFREALERKKQGAQAHNEAPEGGSAVGGVRPRADHKREFRRKSG